MAQMINNPAQAIRGLEFAIGGGRLPWNPAGGGSGPFDGGMQQGPQYETGRGPAGPGIQSMDIGGMDPSAMPLPGRVGDGAKPPVPAIPGAGGPLDVMELSRKVKDLEGRSQPFDGSVDNPVLMGGGGPMGPGGGPIGPSKTRRQGPAGTPSRERARRAAITGLKQSAAGPMMY